MAFNGNLHEFGIVALLQLPNTNRLTGRLSVQNESRTAEFYYTKGKLTHAACGESTGRDVLAMVIDWEQGRFTFETELRVAERTIETDLHHTLMWALKERDEMKKREQERKEAEAKMRENDTTGQDPLPADDPADLPTGLLEAAPHATHACLISRSGVVVARTPTEDEFIEKIQGYISLLKYYVKNYPGKGAGKTFVEDTEFSIGLAGNENRCTAVLFAPPNTRLGILSMELSRFLLKLQETGLGDCDEGRNG